MGDVDAYLSSLHSGADRQEPERLHVLISSRVPHVAQGRSYNMPCYLFRETEATVTGAAAKIYPAARAHESHRLTRYATNDSVAVPTCEH